MCSGPGREIVETNTTTLFAENSAVTSAVAQHRLWQSSLLKICVNQSQASKLVTEDRDEQGRTEKVTYRALGSRRSQNNIASLSSTATLYVPQSFKLQSLKFPIFFFMASLC